MTSHPDISIAQERVFVLVACAVATMPVEEVVQRVNEIRPCGTSAGWMLSEKSKNAPGPCDDHPETHKHYVFEA